MLKSYLSGDESEEPPLQLGPSRLSCDKQQVGADMYGSITQFGSSNGSDRRRGSKGQPNLIAKYVCSFSFGLSFLVVKNQAGVAQHLPIILARLESK